MIKTFLKKNWLILLILGIAAFFRLYRIGDYMEFLGDQGRDVAIIWNFLKNGDLFFIGPQTSIGNMYLGPYFYYLIAPALLLANFNPIGPAILIALIGVATTALLYLVAIHWFDQKTALFSAFLFSISPVVIKYSNFSWNPNIMPFFALLFIYSIGEALIKNKYKYLLLASIAFVFTINSHYLALMLLPTAGLFWIIHLINLIRIKSIRTNSFLINTFLATIIFLISLTPQILFDIKHHGQNINAFIEFFTHRQSTVSMQPYESIPQLIPIFNQLNSSLFSGTNSNYGLPFSILFLLTLIVLSINKFKNIKNIKNQYFLLNISWLFFGLIGLGLYKQNLYSHYFGFLYPVVFILIGLLLSLLYNKKLIGKIISVLIFVILSSICLKSNIFLKPAGNQLTHAYNLAKSVAEHNQNSDGKFNIVLLAAYNDYKGLAPRYFLKNNFPSNQFLDSESYQNIDTLYVILDDPSKWPNGINSDIWEINVSGKKQIVDEFYSSDNTKIYKLSHNINIKP